MCERMPVHRNIIWLEVAIRHLLTTKKIKGRERETLAGWPIWYNTIKVSKYWPWSAKQPLHPHDSTSVWWPNFFVKICIESLCSWLPFGVPLSEIRFLPFYARTLQESYLRHTRGPSESSRHDSEKTKSVIHSLNSFLHLNEMSVFHLFLAPQHNCT